MNAQAQQELTKSMQDYLESILFLIRQNRVARVRDVAARLGVGMPAVTAALKVLSRRKLVNYDPYQYVTLTDRGRELAEEVSLRHHALRRFLTDILGLDGATAEANACRMEHAVDHDLLERLMEFVEFIQRCPRAGADWVESFVATCRRAVPDQRCRECIKGLGAGDSDGKV